MYMTESSLAFTRAFWKKRRFCSTDNCAEFKKFLLFRGEDMVTVPFQFVTIAMTHTTNTSGSDRKIVQQIGNIDLCKCMDPATQNFTKMMVMYLKQHPKKVGKTKPIVCGI